MNRKLNATPWSAFVMGLTSLALLLTGCSGATPSPSSAKSSEPALASAPKPSMPLATQAPLTPFTLQIGDLMMTLPGNWVRDLQTPDTYEFYLSQQIGNLQAGFVSFQPTQLSDWGVNLETRQAFLGNFYYALESSIFAEIPDAPAHYQRRGNYLDLTLRDQHARVYPISLVNPQQTLPGEMLTFVTANTNYMVTYICPPGLEEALLPQIRESLFEIIEAATPANP